MKKLPRVPFFLLLLIVFFAGGALWYATPAGIGLTNDSVAYIGGARSILAGTGYADIWLDSTLEPITHYPPLFSLILSGFGLLGLDPLRGARLLNVLLFALNTGLMGLVGWRLFPTPSPSTSPSLRSGGAILLALLFALNAPLLRIHAYALSEPLYLFFSLSAFILFHIAVRRATPTGASWSLTTNHYLLITGLSVSLACLTRYSGFALAATFAAAIVLLILGWREKLVKTAWFLGGLVPPLAAWFVRNRLVAENATNRVFAYHPVEWENIEFGFFNISQFVMPIEPWRRDLLKSGLLPWFLLGLGLVLLAWLLLTAWKSLFNHPITQSPNHPIVFTTALYAFAYLGAILFSMSFFDASTKFQHRILSPLYICWLVLLVSALSAFTTKITKNTKFSRFSLVYFVSFVVKVFALILALLIIGFSTFDFQQTILELRSADGLGYGSWKWRDANVMTKLKGLPEETIIYTNSPPAVYFVTGRASRVIPTNINPVSGQERDNYAQQMEEMRADLLTGRAVLALFNTDGMENSLGPENFQQFTAGLEVLEKSQGNALYGKP